MPRAMDRQTTKSVSAIAGPVSVWWDLENCHVPSEVSAIHIANNINTVFRAHGYQGNIEIHAYGNINMINSKVVQALSSTGISIRHVPSGANASDMAILVDMLLWALSSPPPAHVLLISNDEDFANALQRLRNRNYTIMVSNQSGKNSLALSASADATWEWRGLAAGHCQPQTGPGTSQKAKQNVPPPPQEAPEEPAKASAAASKAKRSPSSTPSASSEVSEEVPRPNDALPKAKQGPMEAGSSKEPAKARTPALGLADGRGDQSTPKEASQKEGDREAPPSGYDSDTEEEEEEEEQEEEWEMDDYDSIEEEEFEEEVEGYEEDENEVYRFEEPTQRSQEQIRLDLTKLLLEIVTPRPGGFKMSTIPAAFEQRYNYTLNYKAAGAASLSTLLKSMPNVVEVVLPTKGQAWLYSVSPKGAGESAESEEASEEEPEERAPLSRVEQMMADVTKLLREELPHHPSGYTAKALYADFFSRFGYGLDYTWVGHHTLTSFMLSMPEVVTVVKRNSYLLLFSPHAEIPPSMEKGKLAPPRLAVSTTPSALLPRGPGARQLLPFRRRPLHLPMQARIPLSAERTLPGVIPADRVPLPLAPVSKPALFVPPPNLPWATPSLFLLSSATNREWWRGALLSSTGEARLKEARLQSLPQPSRHGALGQPLRASGADAMFSRGWMPAFRIYARWLWRF